MEGGLRIESIYEGSTNHFDVFNSNSFLSCTSIPKRIRCQKQYPLSGQ